MSIVYQVKTSCFLSTHHNSLKQLDELILQYKNKYNFEKSSTVIGFMRLLMMFIDLEGYFDKVYKQSNENWTNIWVKHVVILEQKYPREEIERILKDNDLIILNL